MRPQVNGGESHCRGKSQPLAPLTATRWEGRASPARESDFSRKARNLDLYMKTFHAEINHQLPCFENLEAKHTMSAGLHTWLYPVSPGKSHLLPSAHSCQGSWHSAQPRFLSRATDPPPRPPQAQNRVLGSWSGNGTFV